MKNKTVYIVHNVDTEGPLYESLGANFERVKEVFGHDIDSSVANLEKLQNKEINLDGDEELVKRMLSAKRICAHKTWDHIEQMLDDITSDSFRGQLKDSNGGSWIYNWFCLSHVGLTGLNPRRRDMGYHQVFDFYHEYFDKKYDKKDLIQWHYHPLSLTNDAHRAGTTYLNSNHIYNILSRSIIDRQWFPSVFRAGHVAERPDSNFFLEQWIPFDYSNSSYDDKADNLTSRARFGDWRRAPKSWIPYHPDHDDYQIMGSCRRYIARCLTLNERAYSITTNDIREAFDDAEKYGASILSFTNHDFRDIKPDINKFLGLLKECSKKYPEVRFLYSNAIEAMRKTCRINPISKIGFKVSLEKYKTHTRLVVSASNKIFGPQPYLALKTHDNKYYWQNFDFEDENTWSYSFDANNTYIEKIANIGIAANSFCGLCEVVNIDVATGLIKIKILNKG